MRAGRVLRALRAAVFAAVCVLLASVGHVLMSGHSVPAWMLLSALLGTASAAWFLADRERGPAVVGALTVGTQALLHGVFSLGQATASHGGGSEASLTGRWTAALLGHPLAPSPSPSPSPSGAAPPAGSSHAMHATHGMDGAHAMHGGGMGHHAHHAHQLGGAMPDPAGGAHGAMPGGTAGMIAAHLLVALLAAWWLWGGERAVFRAVRAASVRLFAPLALAVGLVLPAPAPPVRAARQEPAHAPLRLFLGHVIWLRGPPRGRAV